MPSEGFVPHPVPKKPQFVASLARWSVPLTTIQVDNIFNSFKAETVTTAHDSQVASPLAPTPQPERIAALDVIRGFALIGILLMNIEFFNRYSGENGQGIEQGLSGANLWFSYFVQYFVVGKFWTIFSMLFGMGFAVMLMRAEAAQRSFLGPYLRRIAALALFGALHYIFLWSGDILLGYAVTAVALLVVLFGRALYIFLAVVGFAVLGALPGMLWSFGTAGALAFFGLVAWYLRCPDRITVFKRSMPIFKIVVGFLMTVSTVAILVGLLVPGLPREARVIAPVMGAMVLTLAFLMARYHNPVASRPWRIGAGLYSVTMLSVVLMGAIQHYLPNPDNALMRQAPAAASTPAKAAPARPGAVVKKPQSEAERIADKRKKVADMLAEQKKDKDTELRALAKGSYSDAVAFRAKAFGEHAAMQAPFATSVITMFLIGLWFVRSGIMANTRAHLPLFRKLAFIALPFGVGLGLLGAAVATHATPGTPNGHMFASGLLMLGNLPASLGYIGAVVLMLSSRSLLSRISVLAPFGRMALTNYLTHSLVFSFVFYGYGLGHFGMERIWQFACVCAMVLVQVPLSHLWLSRFRYGPMEWLWRAITYWRLPAMRIAPAAATGMLQPV